MDKLTEKRTIDKSLEKNYIYMDERLDLKANYDVGCRKYKVGNRDIHVFFVNGLSDTANMTQLLRQISFVNKPLTNEGAFKTLFEETLANVQVEVVESIDDCIDQLLSGLMVIMGEGWEKALVVDVRKYPGREPEEPDTERVVRGSRDGFTENIIHNTAIVRRRIRDERLRMEMHQVGERSKTDICISYIKDIANPRLVEELRQQLEKIDVDGIPMGEKAIEEFVIKQGYNPFPKVRFTERPDVAAAHLYEGHVLIMVDTSPAVIILPTTYFHHLQHAEEFRQTPFIGLYVRWIRFIGILSAIFLLPLYTLFVMEPALLPEKLKFIGPQKDNYALPIFLQFLIAELGIDMMRMAAIHTPTPLATAMGLVAAILIGEIAIQVGLFVPEVILYLAVAAIGTFATPSYEVSMANKMIRLGLLLLVVLFKVPGFVIGVTVTLVALSMMKSLRTPYLWPFIPFNLKAFATVILRLTSSMTKTRPSIVHPLNKRKQPGR
ncbi:stage V sporulation protein AF [Caldalkalibacillus uzonensis]|uniref:Stage V sporulation protein AF n=1 Tax=Caldalkalibacillus uzonensis TaxID=353224 RepID=A0ABU0CTG0_9BACI|nr:spore germination protein [Caldalkalibacillus uzonensis]MDQ0339169.1 stage V sporulation protein AF [Caldalkalibacillus uzonensis]